MRGEKVLIPFKLLKYMGFIDDIDDNVSSEDEELTSKELLEEHIKSSIEENACEHIDSDKATRGAQNIELLTKAMEHLEKAEAERLKVELQIDESKKRQWISWDVVIPKLFSIGVLGLVTIFWICLEQGTPVPLRLVKLTNDLLTPRGL